jgi:methionyl-tRNA formyltransferase
MQMDEGLDTGPILAQTQCPIGPDERAIDLRERLAHLSAKVILDALAHIEDLTATPQTTAGILHAQPMGKSEASLDFSQSAQSLHNQIRAFYPWPGSQTMFRGEQFKIHRARVVDAPGQSEAPGTIILAKKRMIVACGQGALEVLEAQLPGKKALPVQAILNGARIQNGEHFGQPSGEET